MEGKKRFIGIIIVAAVFIGLFVVIFSSSHPQNPQRRNQKGKVASTQKQNLNRKKTSNGKVKENASNNSVAASLLRMDIDDIRNILANLKKYERYYVLNDNCPYLFSDTTDIGFIKRRLKDPATVSSMSLGDVILGSKKYLSFFMSLKESSQDTINRYANKAKMELSNIINELTSIASKCTLFFYFPKDSVTIIDTVLVIDRKLDSKSNNVMYSYSFGGKVYSFSPCTEDTVIHADSVSIEWRKERPYVFSLKIERR